jgi:hypothetical protein
MGLLNDMYIYHGLHFLKLYMKLEIIIRNIYCIKRHNHYRNQPSRLSYR